MPTQIKPNIFFKAPFELYKDIEFIELKFFTTQKAVGAYRVYMRQLQEESPDSIHHINFIKDSLRFIGMFCIKNKIPIENYSTYSSGVTYKWMQHVKEHNVSIYIMFIFPEILNIIRNTPNDELDLFLGDVAINIANYKNRYNTSKEARRIIKEGYMKVKGVIDKTL